MWWFTSSFPYFRGLGMSKMFVTLWAGKISIWDIEKVKRMISLTIR